MRGEVHQPATRGTTALGTLSNQPKTSVTFTCPDGKRAQIPMQIKHLAGNLCRLLTKAGARPASLWQLGVPEAPCALEAAAPLRVCPSGSTLLGGLPAFNPTRASQQKRPADPGGGKGRRELLLKQRAGSSQRRWLWLRVQATASPLHPTGAQVTGIPQCDNRLQTHSWRREEEEQEIKP